MAINASQGPTGLMGPTGPMGPAGPAITVIFDAVQADSYTEGQIVQYGGADYIVKVDSPIGTPSTSPDYILLSAAAPTGPTGAAGAATIVTYDPVDSIMYVKNQLVQLNGIIYVVSKANPSGTPGVSPADYTLLTEFGPAGIDGATGPTGAAGEATIIKMEMVGPAAPDYIPSQLVFYEGAEYIMNTTDPITLPVFGSDEYRPLVSIGPTGPDSANGVTGPTGYPGFGAIISFDSGSYNFGLESPPVISLNSVALDLVATNVILGAKMWGPESAVLGAPLQMSNLGLPPWPVKITRGGIVYQWSASIEALATMAPDLSILDPMGALGLKKPETHAQLLYARTLSSTPQSMLNYEFQVIDDMNLGVIPVAGAAIAFSGNQYLPAPGVLLKPGDYLLIRFYINSNLIASVTGFHAQATVAMS